jgi:hypothetical protein
VAKPGISVVEVIVVIETFMVLCLLTLKAGYEFQLPERSKELK